MKKLACFCACLLAIGPLGAWEGPSPNGRWISAGCLLKLRQLTVERSILRDVENSNSEKIDAKAASQLWAVGGPRSDFARTYFEKLSCKTMRNYLSKTFELMDCFTLDSNGKIVATLYPTPNFVQDREPYFAQCYNHGQGKLFIDKPEAIKASEGHVVKISIPIQEGDKTIGVLVATVLLDR